MRVEGIEPQLVLCSSSRRTRETLDLLQLAPETGVCFDGGLYAASEHVLLERLRAVPDDFASVMLVGHSSGIEQLALMLARRGARLGEMREKFPTGALATIEFNGRWSTLDGGDAELTGYVVPRELAAR